MLNELYAELRTFILQCIILRHVDSFIFLMMNDLISQHVALETLLLLLLLLSTAKRLFLNTCCDNVIFHKYRKWLRGGG